MIDWHVVTKRKSPLQFPDGYDSHKDGCSFTDWKYQRLLLPLFQTAEVTVDEYDGAYFNAAQVKELEQRLVWALERFEKAPSHWEGFELASVEMVVYERSVIVQTLAKTIEMARVVRRIGGLLVFRGD
jgi:hypothetical protein